MNSKYKPAVLFGLFMFVFNLVMTKVAYAKELNLHNLWLMIISDLIGCIIGGSLFGWMWNWMKNKRMQS